MEDVRSKRKARGDGEGEDKRERARLWKCVLLLLEIQFEPDPKFGKTRILCPKNEVQNVWTSKEAQDQGVIRFSAEVSATLERLKSVTKVDETFAEKSEDEDDLD